MKTALASDFPNGGLLPSCPTSPVREAPSNLLAKSSDQQPTVDIKFALQKGICSKNYTKKIVELCANLPEGVGLLSKTQKYQVIKLAKKCRSVRTVKEILRFVEPPVTDAVSYFLSIASQRPTLSELKIALEHGCRSRKYKRNLVRLYAKLPEDIGGLRMDQRRQVIKLAEKCQSVREVRHLLRFENRCIFKCALPSETKLVERALRKERKRLEQANCKGRKLLTPEERQEGARRCMRNWRKKKLATDMGFRACHRLRKRLLKVLNGRRKSGRMVELLGCSSDQLRSHLESLWQPGMTWANYGVYGWHIDHIRPCASFDMSDPKQQAECFHHTNLQPLWAKDNIAKGARYEQQNTVKRVYKVVGINP